MDFVVIRTQREEHDPVALARILAGIRGTPAQDQMIQARGAWGIVEEGMTQEEARALAKSLRAAGMACAVGPAAGLARLPEAVPAKDRESLPPSSPILVAVAGITVSETTTTQQSKSPGTGQQIAGAAIMMTTGLPIKVGGRKKTVQKTQTTESLVFYADLHYEEPRRRLRIAASSFDFSCLKERMLYHAQGNLKLLLSDVVGAAPEAWQNHGARVLLEGRPIRTMGYGSLEDLEREERWLLTLRKMKS